MVTPALVYSASFHQVSVYQPEKEFTAYLEKNVRVLEKNPTILRPEQYLRSGDVYLLDTSVAQSKSHVYLELIIDWAAPINLSAKADQIRISSLLGEATAIIPDSAKKRVPTSLKVGQILPAGATIRVGTDGCVGLDIGGRHAVCLTPNSVATIDRENSHGKDQITVHLKTGAVFSHINSRKEV